MEEIDFKPNLTANVLVVGDIILDQYIHGETNRISPEAPVPIVRVSNTEERPGGAANVAINISSLGLNTQLLGITGQDEASARLEGMLSRRGVECHFVHKEGFPTITKQRVLSQHQQLIRLDYEEKTHVFETNSLVEKFLELLELVDVIVLSDYAKGSLVEIESLIEHANNKNITVLVDPKSTDFNPYSKANVITPNLKELEAIVGDCKNDEILFKKADDLRKELQLEALLVTRGEKGMTLFHGAESPFHLKAKAHEVYDVTGAGDTVIAVLAASLASGYEIKHATSLANTAAGLVVEKLGAATISTDELNDANLINYETPNFLDKTSLREIISRAKNEGKKIVMTNGCFDIIHAGHVNYLAKAKSLGDYLVVAVNDDASVKRLKGEARPINNIINRMIVLNAFAFVDWVIAFNEDTPEELITLFSPDVLVKGGDYSEDQIAGAKHVKKTGGKVVILPFEEGCSTSLMLEKILENN